MVLVCNLFVTISISFALLKGDDPLIISGETSIGSEWCIRFSQNVHQHHTLPIQQTLHFQQVSSERFFSLIQF